MTNKEELQDTLSQIEKFITLETVQRLNYHLSCLLKAGASVNVAANTILSALNNIVMNSIKSMAASHDIENAMEQFNQANHQWLAKDRLKESTPANTQAV